MNKIYKTDIFGGKMNDRQFAAGRAMQRRMFNSGRFASSTMDAEATAPKTWILWRDGPLLPNGERPTIECELYTVPRASDGREGVGMLIGQCPICLMEYGQDNHFTVREDNKEINLDWVQYGKLPANHHLAQHWARHSRDVLLRQPKSDDRIAIVSSPSRWQCDYCKGFCVRVTDSIAMTDTKGATVMWVTAPKQKTLEP